MRNMRKVTSRRRVGSTTTELCAFESEANSGAVGNVTGSKEWQESGKKDAREGINEMKVRFSRDLFLFLHLVIWDING